MYSRVGRRGEDGDVRGIGDVVGLWPDRLVELVSTPGSMTVARTMQLARRLAAALPPA